MIQKRASIPELCGALGDADVDAQLVEDVGNTYDELFAMICANSAAQ